MKTLHIAPLAATPILLAAWTPRVDEVSFRPAEDLTVTKNFSIEGLVELGDISMVVQGNDMSDQVPGDVAVEFDIAMTVTEQFVESEDGRPIDLIRTYDSLEGSYEASGGGESNGGDIEDFDELEDTSVRFQWDEEAEEYEISYHESDGDEDLLESIGDDMDFRTLLPDGEVEEGETWSLSAEQIGTALLFGGGQAEYESDDPEFDEIMELIEPEFERMAEDLLLSAEYKGRRTVDGTEVGVIGITAAGEGSVDFIDTIETLIASQAPDEIDIDVSIDEALLEISINGTGELLWNMEAGHFHKMEMSSEMEFILTIAMEVDAAGQSFPVEGDLEILGEIDWAAEAVEPE